MLSRLDGDAAGALPSHHNWCIRERRKGSDASPMWRRGPTLPLGCTRSGRTSNVLPDRCIGEGREDVRTTQAKEARIGGDHRCRTARTGIEHDRSGKIFGEGRKEGTHVDHPKRAVPLCVGEGRCAETGGRLMCRSGRPNEE